MREALGRGDGLAGERDNGNGPLMRTAPLAFIDATVAGIVYGIEGIPAEWLDKLWGRGVIEACLFWRSKRSVLPMSARTNEGMDMPGEAVEPKILGRR